MCRGAGHLPLGAKWGSVQQTGPKNKVLLKGNNQEHRFDFGMEDEEE